MCQDFVLISVAVVFCLFTTDYTNSQESFVNYLKIQKAFLKFKTLEKLFYTFGFLRNDKET